MLVHLLSRLNQHPWPCLCQCQCQPLEIQLRPPPMRAHPSMSAIRLFTLQVCNNIHLEYLSLLEEEKEVVIMIMLVVIMTMKRVVNHYMTMH